MIYSFLPLLLSLSRTEFNSDGSNKDMTYRDTVKVKGNYKSGWDSHSVAEWDALSFPSLKGLGVKYYYYFSGRAGAMERGPSRKAGKITATAEPECRGREGIANKQLKLSSLPADLLKVFFNWPKSARSQPTTKNGQMMRSTIYKAEQREAENKWWCVCVCVWWRWGEN